LARFSGKSDLFCTFRFAAGKTCVILLLSARELTESETTMTTTTVHEIDQIVPDVAIVLHDGDTLEFSGEALAAYRTLSPLDLEHCDHVYTDSCSGTVRALESVLRSLVEGD
jgi:hypothetical protein